MFKGRLFTFSQCLSLFPLSHLTMSVDIFIIINNFHILINFVIANSTCTYMVQRALMTKTHATTMTT
jgi:hypothetical protein